ncbi:hypothetical protein Vretimale_12422 [Volvox reticuliferus]|uniref:Uncharacterized protein n=1 Tax=Volvox reticuliferus TaxID=1737510 RepID=A0A8J4GIF4_9CHLO|nr:hypothetical protein Vretifemale_9097 [Volvox reticuliferus]GIM08414.1 hypothetical protein Vretimale_12422 [Volvox reticuliferus]
MLLTKHQRLIVGGAGGRGRNLSFGALCSASPRLETVVKKARTKDDLLDPAQIGASGSASAKFQILPQYESLQSYMMLPVEQYFVLDPKQISHLGGNRFVLTVPRINLFNLWLEAVVEVSVTTYPGSNGAGPRVVLQAENCRISGSQAVESLRLDQRFAMHFVTELTWSATPVAAPVPAATAAAATAAVGPAPIAAAAVSTSGVMNGEIRASSKLDVWSEVVPPFHLLPRDVLVATCNGVLRGLMSSLLPLFVRMLAQDYQRWAKDPEYRAERATRSGKAFTP